LKYAVLILALIILSSSSLVYAKNLADYEHGPGSWQLTNTQVVITSGNPKIQSGSATGSCAGGGTSELTWTIPPSTAIDRQQVTIDFTGSSTQPEPAPSDADNAEQIARMKCGVATYSTGIGINFNGTSCASFYDASATGIPPHKWNVDSPESYRHYTFAFPTLAKAYICSRPSQNNMDLTEENIDKHSRMANELWFNMLVMVETAGGDGYIIYTYTWVPGDVEEMVTVHGSVSNVDDEPLPFARTVIKINGKEHETYTDKDGDYAIKVPKPKKDSDSWLYVSLNYKRDNKNYFNVYYLASQNRYQDMWFGKKVDLSASDVEANLKAKIGSFEKSTFTTPQQQDRWLEDSAAAYYHMHEAVDFCLITLKADIDNKLPVDLWLGNLNGETKYLADSTDILIEAVRSNRNNPNQPWIPYHEFAHHLMYSEYKGPLATKSAEGMRNHGGFINPNSADAWTEGFAEFIAVAMAKHNGNRQYATYGNLANFDDTYRVWENRGYREEYAVADTLFDLYDEGTLSLEDLWSVMRQKHETVFDFYNALKSAHPRKAEAIDKAFIAHAIFSDTAVGNKKRDSFEPFNDVNGDRAYQVGEVFVDYGCQTNESELVYKKGYTVGKPTNYERPARAYGGMVPDYFLSVTDTQVWLYDVKVDYADGQGKDYTYTSVSQGGKLYIHPLPFGVKAIITVTPQSKDFTTDQPYIITSSKMSSDWLLAEGKGAFDTHTFNLKPTGSTLDPPAPEGIDAAVIMDNDDSPSEKPQLIQMNIGESTGGSSGGFSIWIIVVIIAAAIAGFFIFKTWRHKI